MVAVLGGSLFLARDVLRTASGEAEAEADLSMLSDLVVTTHARDKRLCRASILSSTQPLAYSGSREPTADEASEKKENVGFACLGLDPSRLVGGKNMYTYEVSGERFVLRAFRACLYDTDGVLPRYERRGEVRAGRVILDPHLYRVAPGGTTFPGHPCGNASGDGA
jgi:hypothetical protein